MKRNTPTLIVLLMIALSFGLQSNLTAQTPQWELQQKNIITSPARTSATGWGVHTFNNLIYNTTITGALWDYQLDGTDSGFSVGIGSFTDIGSDGTNYYIGSGNSAEVSVFDFGTNTITSTINVSFLNTPHVFCVAHDETSNGLWVAGGNDASSNEGATTDIFLTDLNGNQVRSIDAASLGLSNMMGFAHHIENGTPYLWVSTFDGVLHKVDLTNDTVVLRKDMSYLAGSISESYGLRGLFTADDVFEAGTTTLGGLAYRDTFYFFNADTMEFINPDAGITSIDFEYEAAVAVNTDVSATVKNFGTTPLSNVDVAYTVDGVTVETENFTFNPALEQFEETVITFTNAWNNTALEGTAVTIQVSAENPNGADDDDNDNDAQELTVMVGTGISGTKKVLLEASMVIGSVYNIGWNKLSETIDASENQDTFTLVNLHAGGASIDDFTLPASEPVYSLANGGLRLVLDRKKHFQYDYSPGIFTSHYNGDDIWDRVFNTIKNDWVPCDIEIDNVINGNDNADVTVTVNYVDYGLPGEHRISLYVIENGVSLGTKDYDNVIRGIYPLGNDGLYNWGESGVIPSNPEPGDVYTHTFEDVVIDPSWDTDSVQFIAIVNYSDSNNGNEPVNSNWEYMNPQTAGISDNLLENSIELYPNPASTAVNIHVASNSGELINKIDVISLLGQTVLAQDEANATESSIDTSSLASGNYFVTITLTNGIIVKKLIIE